MAPWLRKRSPAGRFLLVTLCIRVCHCGSIHSSVHVHMVYSVRAKLAVRITARFADPRPFCSVTRAPGCSPDWLMPRIPAGRFFAVPLAPGGGLALFVWGAPRPGRAAGSARAISSRLHGERVTGVWVAATGREDHNDAVASGAVPGSGRRGEPRRHAAKFPVSRSGTGSGIAGHVPVVDWRWTRHVPAVYLRR
jgi:hypothetical protein